MHLYLTNEPGEVIRWVSIVLFVTYLGHFLEVVAVPTLGFLHYIYVYLFGFESFAEILNILYFAMLQTTSFSYLFPEKLVISTNWL